jgi:late competence protein required for DNA uptake (superfamily II DNA/RNA helicase)
VAEENVRVVQVHGEDTYERIWRLVGLGAVVTVEFVRDGDRRMLATTTIVDGHGVTLDRTAVEV